MPLWFSYNVTRNICVVMAVYLSLNTCINFISTGTGNQDSYHSLTDRMTGYGAGSQREPVSTDRGGRRDPADPGSIPGESVLEGRSATASLFLLAKIEKIKNG